MALGRPDNLDVSRCLVDPGGARLIGGRTATLDRTGGLSDTGRLAGQPAASVASATVVVRRR